MLISQAGLRLIRQDDLHAQRHRLAKRLFPFLGSYLSAVDRFGEAPAI